MKIQHYSECLELSAVRATKFYLELRPYAQERLASKVGIVCRYIEEDDEKKLTHIDRYFLKLDILLGQLIKNIKIRQFWKSCLCNLKHNEEISSLSIETLDKTYLNELVVLFERMGRVLVLIEKAFKEIVKVEDLEVYLLKFFNPLLFEKRNYTHHRMYLGFPGITELNKFEENVRDQATFDCYFDCFQKCITERIDWIDYTEVEMAKVLTTFLERVHDKISNNKVYLDPESLPSNFSCNDKLDVNFRKKYNHTKLYDEA